MPTPAVAQEALPYAFGATYLAFLAQQPPELVIGSFTGAVVYLLGVKDKPTWVWMALFSVALLAGLIGGPVVADITSGAIGLFGIKVKVPLGMGGMVSASCTVSALGWLRDNPTFFFKKKGEAQ